MDAAQGTNGDFAKRYGDTGAHYVDLRALCVRLSLSRRTVRSFINDPANPLPAYKCGGGKLLCKWAEVERWIRRHRVRSHVDIDPLSMEICDSANLTQQG